MLLTFQEYSDFGFKKIEEETFNQLVNKATDVINYYTNNFYVRRDILIDEGLHRVIYFKKAIAAQIEYFDEKGATTVNGLNTFQSVSIGRTTVSNGTNASISNNGAFGLMSNDAMMYLEMTGLLYRGVGVRS